MQIFGRNQSAPKHFVNGTHRLCSPEQTLQKYMPLMPRLGITRLANITGLDRIGLPVYVAVRPNSRALATSQGKGETAAAAKTSALMESIETWHGERTQGLLQIGSVHEVAATARIADLTRLELAQGARLTLDRPMPWILGEDLLSAQPTWLPYECAHNNFVETLGVGHQFVKSSNGLASGNHVLEALSHGLCELVERDALNHWQGMNAAQRLQRRVRLNSIEDGAFKRVWQRLQQVGLELLVWDIRSGVGLPAYTCVLFENPHSTNWRPTPVMAGHGCHLNPAIALSRAVHEAIQSRVTVISGSRDDMFPEHYLNHSGMEKHLRLLAEAHTDNERICFQDQNPCLAQDSFEGDVALILQRLRAYGIDQVIALDLSRQEIGVPVVKLVVPGLALLGRAGKSIASTQSARGVSTQTHEVIA